MMGCRGFREEWVAAIRYVSSQLSAAGGAGAAGGAAGAPLSSMAEGDDCDIAQLGTSFRDPRRIVSQPPSYIMTNPNKMATITDLVRASSLPICHMYFMVIIHTK